MPYHQDLYSMKNEGRFSSTSLHYDSSKEKCVAHRSSLRDSSHRSAEKDRTGKRNKQEPCQILDIKQSKSHRTTKEDKTMLSLKDFSDACTWKVCVRDFKGFNAEEFVLTIEGKNLTICGNHEESKGPNSIKKHITRIIGLPSEIDPNCVSACLCADGSVLVQGPKARSKGNV